MIASFIPAFTLTVGAADITDYTTVFNGSREGTGAATIGTTTGTNADLANVWDGWTSTATGDTAVNGQGYTIDGVTHNVIQFYNWNYNNGGGTGTVTMPDYASGAENMVIRWYFKRSSGASTSGNDYADGTSTWCPNYGSFTFYDIDGKSIASFTMDKNWPINGTKLGSSYTASYPFGWPDEGALLEIAFLKNETNGNVDVVYSIDGETTYSTTIDSFNGIQKLYGNIGTYNAQYAHIGFGDLMIYATYPDTTKFVTASYKVGDEEVYSLTYTYNTSLGEENCTFPAYYYSADGSGKLYYTAGATLSEDGYIDMELQDNPDVNGWAVGKNIRYTNSDGDDEGYTITGSNIIPNGNFDIGDDGLVGWLNGSGADATTTGFTVNGDGTVTSKDNDGASSDYSLYKTVPIDENSTYFYTYYGNGSRDSNNDYRVTVLTNTVSSTAGDTETSGSAYWLVGSYSNYTGALASVSAVGTNEYIFTNTDYGYLRIHFRWLGSDTYGKFGLYKVERNDSVLTTTTIKYVDSEGTEIATSQTIDGVIGDVIDLTDTDLVPNTISYSSNVYSYASAEVDSTEVEGSYTVAASETTITLICETDAVTSVTPATAAVISGTTPVLPTTLDAETGKGNATTVSGITWTINEDDITNTGTTIKTATIYGSAEGITADITATVTVYPLSYELDDITCPANTSGVAAYAELLQAATGDLVIEFEYTPNGVQNNWIYISNGQKLWSAGAIGFGTSDTTAGSFNTQSSGTVLGTVSTGTTYHMLVETTVSDHTYTLTMASDGDNIWTNTDSYRTASDSLDTIVVSTNGASTSFTLTNIKVYDPDVVRAEYTVNYVDTEGNTLDKTLNEDGDATDSYATIESNTLGYDDEVVCDYVPIPYFTGYVFKNKTVVASEKKIILTYDETDTSAYFFADADSDATLISLNMLGAHDAFTANIGDVKYDAAGIATEDSGSESFIAAQGSSLAVNMSKAQSADALELLNSGVRYFDIRLSHSTADVDYDVSFLGLTVTSYTAPHTNGVFYTTHGGLSDEFRPIAYTIAQWAKQHPGEIIILNFQSAFEDGGTATTDTWSAINDILEESGINDFVSIKNSNAGSGNLAGATISSYTDDREHAGILVFGQSTGANNNIGNFILNKYSDEFDGRLYSNYETDLDTGIQSSFSADYIQSQVDYADTFGSGDDNHIITWMMRVMQAQSESIDLISQAYDDNTALYTALASGNCTDWLTALPIVMVNDAVTNTADLLALLQSHNKAREITVNYVNGESTVATKTKSLMTGTLYTDETTYGIINGSDAKYYVTSAPTTVYNNGIILVPSTGDISVDVTATGDIYTYASADGTNADGTTRTAGTILSSDLVTTKSNNTFTGLNSFGACNWGSDGTYDRIGIAVLDLPDKTEAGVDADCTDAVSYVLKATQVRNYSEGYLNTKFYAIPYSTYLTTDFSVGTNVTDLIKDATPIAKYSNEENSDYNVETPVEYTLTGLEDTDGSGKIVIIGCSTVGLYVLTGMSIEPEINYGIELVDGAQIRIGGGVTSDNELNGEDSGLRFIAVLTTDNTLASYVQDDTVNAVPGIAIWDGGVVTEEVDASAIAQADLDNPVATYDADKYQNTDKTIFSVAITNISESNYNRIYVAVPYIRIGTDYYYNYEEAVARTPYQVAAGILTNNGVSALTDSKDNTYVYDADVNTVLMQVLNVYANKTGARITLDSSYKAAVAEYSNGAAAFFTVACAENEEDGTYTITFTVEDGSSALFYSYAADTYRVNNSHKNFAETFGVTEDDIIISDDGTTMTIVITPPSNTETE
ncbi:MAG: hypothetical protein LUG52_10585 [Clostridia bacterium]|nr:hypothetical protein [Clostridia bacterium]